MASLFLLSTASLYFSSLARSFRLAQDVGFDGVELSLTPAGVLSSPEEVRAWARRADLLVASVHPPTVPLPGWGSSARGCRRLARLARSFSECRMVVLHVPDAYREDDPRMVRFLRTLDVLQAELAGSPIMVALENRNRRPGEPLGPLDDPGALLEFARRRGCGVVLDTAHASTFPFPLLEAYRALRKGLLNVHLSDVKPGRWWDRFSYPRSILTHHQPPGRGILPLGELLAELGRGGYAGLITLELSPLAIRSWSRPAMRRILRGALEGCRRSMGLASAEGSG